MNRKNILKHNINATKKIQDNAKPNHATNVGNSRNFDISYLINDFLKHIAYYNILAR